MARYTGPVCKQCRREGQKLFLKGTKCYTEKCPVERRQYPPGHLGPAAARRRKQSDYAVQLREKQKVKRMYGLHEKQFRNLFAYAAGRPGVTGENLIVALESRLDNVVFRLGLAANRRQARQLVRHRHVQVNGATVNIPSYRLAAGDEVALREGSRELDVVEASLGARSRPQLLDWLALDEKNRVGRVVRKPTRGEVPLAAQEQLIVELYSK
ncbi:MAG: 30S ribosomal protein S4 [Gemmatimonadota bacterium]|nr:30S ribosomal protein S4 [Gemmatimonadota bacterium]MDE2783277.1 30S ribosomal protein S4 [Gemmatimonadota bacterium]MDE2863669.1 30S ribosomal protein S4 [Gemmatimonadota bacterium]MXX71031.1 30S ribosomal protein S4 [Gemmatimonadota bacterium]MYB06001.1 30S ribosomal protein S4 [Gemmatimonadota bacterium]